MTDNFATRVDEYYFDSRLKGYSRTDEEHYEQLEKLAENRDIRFVVVDSSASSFIECVRRHGKFGVKKADNDVLNGIRRTSTLMKADCLRVHEKCADFLREIKLYRWDEKSACDTVLKENDHAMDDMRYLVNTVLKYGILRNIGGE